MVDASFVGLLARARAGDRGACRPPGPKECKCAANPFMRRIIPGRAAEASLPLDVFVIGVKEPAAVLNEYARITGYPEMPPLWCFGYQQSHRTLGPPEEILQEAKTFREKKLPCDAMIYLGTGFTPVGWNTNNGEFTWNVTSGGVPGTFAGTAFCEAASETCQRFPVMVLACAVPTPAQTKIPAKAVATIDFLIACLLYVKKHSRCLPVQQSNTSA